MSSTVRLNWIPFFFARYLDHLSNNLRAFRSSLSASPCVVSVCLSPGVAHLVLAIQRAAHLEMLTSLDDGLTDSLADELGVLFRDLELILIVHREYHFEVLSGGQSCFLKMLVGEYQGFLHDDGAGRLQQRVERFVKAALPYTLRFFALVTVSTDVELAAVQTTDKTILLELLL